MKNLFNLAFIILISLSSCNNLNAQNIALGKNYTLSATPNYKFTALATDTKSLTDGIHTKGHFWSQSSTVGWEGSPKASISIDLNSIQPIKAVTYNTARNINAEVYFPANIFVFLSTDNQNFIYAGDAALDKDNLPGEYQVKKFALNNINQSARYIVLTIVPKGMYIFSDEIEVLKGNVSIPSPHKFISKINLENAADILERAEYVRKKLKETVNRISKDWAQKTIVNNNDLSTINNQLDEKYISPEALQEIKSKILKVHSQSLKTRFSASFIIEKYNPWDMLEPIHEPLENSRLLNNIYTIPNDGVQYGAFVITNSTQLNQTFDFHISTTDQTVASLELFNVPYVTSQNYTQVPDPLVPVNKAVLIPSGVSQLLIYKMTGKKKGVTASTITIHSDLGKVDLKIKSHIVGLFPSHNENDLNAINWGYLSFNIIKDLKKEASEDMHSHHINTVVVPPQFIPKPSDTNFKGLTDYLAYFKNAKNILLFTGYASAGNRNTNKNIQFMSVEWKGSFLQWYNNMTKAIHNCGFSSAQVYLYPYDEVRGKDIGDFKEFLNWVKQAIPRIQIYATLDNKEAIDAIMPLVDIAQIHNNINLYGTLPAHHCGVWVYTTKGEARSMSPYKYYQLMAWAAFANDIKGIGFWNYADIGMDKKQNLISDTLKDAWNDYAVIYNGPGKDIISSRRWEAFRLGIEDYRLLTLYGKKFGIEKAKALAKKVLAAPNNVNLAQSVRNEILKSL